MGTPGLSVSRFARAYLFLLLGLSQCAGQEPARHSRPHAAERAPRLATDPATGPLEDGDVSAAVRALLDEAPGVEASGVDMAATQGIIELSGIVTTVLCKRRAVAVARAVRGARGVVDLLSLQVPLLPDREIGSRVLAALTSNAVTRRYEIAARSVDGSVTIEGRVRSSYARQLAGRLVQGTRGVRMVDNRLNVDVAAPRSDEEIALEVASRLHWDVLVDSTRVQVHTTNGSVLLSGNVPSAAQRRQAQADAWLDGVRAVDASGLEVRDDRPDLVKGWSSRPSGFQIAMAIRDALAYDPRVGAADVHPLVSGELALLRGSVNTEAERLAAEETVRNTSGVADVTNELRTHWAPAANDTFLEQELRSTLSRSVVTRGLPISVTARGGKVTLAGEVGTALQRTHATRLVASVEGARDVDNALVVESSRRSQPLHGTTQRWNRTSSLLATDAPRTHVLEDRELIGVLRGRMQASPLLDGKPISLEVAGGVATLNGTVESIRQRVAATRTAYEGGATFVDNRLRVADLD